MDNKQEFGPQYKYDKPFTARMRFHQSWYRGENIKNLSPLVLDLRKIAKTNMGIC